MNRISEERLFEYVNDKRICNINAEIKSALAELLERRQAEKRIATLEKRIVDLESKCIPDGWKLVPIEPTEKMIIDGFESEPDELFSDDEVWQRYKAMSGCKQAAHRTKLCWAAMLQASPPVWAIEFKHIDGVSYE